MKKNLVQKTSLRMLARQVLVFLLAGGLSAVTDLVTFLLLQLIGFNVIGSNLVATFAGLFTNFVINSWNFLGSFSRVSLTSRHSMKFAAVALVSACYTFLMYQFLVGILALTETSHLTMLRAVVIASGTAIRFFALKLWVFQTRH